MKKLLPLYISEFIGTFFLVFIGCGSVILFEQGQSQLSPFIPVIFGGIISVMIYSVGHISGAHFNPAVTIAFWVCGRFPRSRIFGYCGFQFLGALLASALHGVIFGFDHSFGLTVVQLPLSAGVLVELVLSLLLMFVIISVATDSRAVGEMAGIAIGSTVALCAFVGGPLTGASMNPARSLAPAVLAGDYSFLWLYFLVPVIGTVVGGKLYEWIRCNREESSSEHGCC